MNAKTNIKRWFKNVIEYIQYTCIMIFFSGHNQKDLTGMFQKLDAITIGWSMDVSDDFGNS
jgi:hypothetical protein